MNSLPHIDGNPTRYDPPPPATSGSGIAFTSDPALWVPAPDLWTGPHKIAPPAPPSLPTPNADCRVLAWFERQSPAVQAAVVALATTLVNQLAPWLAPLVRAVAGSGE